MFDSNLTVFLARTRSGTTVIRRSIAKHSGLDDLGEIFLRSNPKVKSIRKIRSSFFSQFTSDIGAHLRKAETADWDRLFASFRGLSTNGAPIIADIKYDSYYDILWSLFAKPGGVTLLQWLIDRKIKVVHIIRANYLDRLVSSVVANERKQHHYISGEEVPLTRVYIDLFYGVKDLAKSVFLISYIDSYFRGNNKYFSFSYEELFADGSDTVNANVYNRILTFLGESGSDNFYPVLQKATPRPKSEVITNWADISALVTGTPMSWMANENNSQLPVMLAKDIGDDTFEFLYDYGELLMEIESPDGIRFYTGISLPRMTGPVYRKKIQSIHKKLISLSASNPQNKTLLATIKGSIAELEFRMGTQDRAHELIEETIRLAPECASILHSVGRIISENGKPMDALGFIGRAIEIDPMVAAHHYRKGMIYSEIGRNEEAVNFHKKAIELEPDNVTYHQQLSTSYFKLNKYELAATHQEKATNASPRKKKNHRINLQGAQQIDAGRITVWKIVNDPVLIAKQLPICQSLEAVDDNTYGAVIRIRAGPFKRTLSAILQITDIQPPEGYTLSMDAGFAKGTITIRLEEAKSKTVLRYYGELKIRGVGKRVGKYIAEPIARSLAKKILKCLSSAAESAD